MGYVHIEIEDLLVASYELPCHDFVAIGHALIRRCRIELHLTQDASVETLYHGLGGVLLLVAARGRDDVRTACLLDDELSHDKVDPVDLLFVVKLENFVGYVGLEAFNLQFVFAWLEVDALDVLNSDFLHDVVLDGAVHLPGHVVQHHREDRLRRHFARVVAPTGHTSTIVHEWTLRIISLG